MNAGRLAPRRTDVTRDRCSPAHSWLCNSTFTGSETERRGHNPPTTRSMAWPTAVMQPTLSKGTNVPASIQGKRAFDSHLLGAMCWSPPWCGDARPTAETSNTIAMTGRCRRLPLTGPNGTRGEHYMGPLPTTGIGHDNDGGSRAYPVLIMFMRRCG